MIHANDVRSMDILLTKIQIWPKHDIVQMQNSSIAVGPHRY